MRITWEAKVPTRWPEHRGDVVSEDQHHTDLETMDAGKYARVYVALATTATDCPLDAVALSAAIFSEAVPGYTNHDTLRAIQGRRLRITMETIDD